VIKILAIEKCDGCETCGVNCPLGVLEVRDERVQIVDRSMCTDCGICIEVCPKGILERDNELI
jgi:NAD-dependent dihydropyrimidine dehydrogenase PreA subunit